jgi:hypothetical protein
MKYRDNPFRYWRFDLRAWKSILKGDFNFGAGSILPRPEVDQVPRRKESPDDYWDGEVNYETGEVISDSGPTIRYPKNRDRAYSGSAERFHDGSG